MGLIFWSHLYFSSVVYSKFILKFIYCYYFSIYLVFLGLFLYVQSSRYWLEQTKPVI